MLLICLLGPVVAMLLSCATTPTQAALDMTPDPAKMQMCRRLFPEKPWQFQHAIETRMPGGRSGFFIGVTQVSPAEGQLHAVVLTLDGMVLLDVLYDGQVSVRKAVALFDSDDFAERLIQDIRFIYFGPETNPSATGGDGSGGCLCRYPQPGGGEKEIVIRPDRSWEIRSRNRDGEPEKTVYGAPPDPSRPLFHTPKMTVTAHTTPRYHLILRFVEAVALSGRKPMKGDQ